MDKTLGYLLETLSNYSDHHVIPQRMMNKLENTQYNSEGTFIRELNEEELIFLNKVLPDEIKYALESQDFKRVQELNEVYELLP
ncbi:sigma-G-dependent sporulation-specific acid-soluble spore protein CsgA [Fredinandcohnia quinoae]|uniref:Sigma-G-dependent sporulation-specific acid-soluble spore protein CsgA n=1 Tax=Fredinandcohnia quinoae TaxID=2918902 RepID=A0AAW5E523_9BACI|nr:sigma-G-dependent sporulation-specific acid-soluble spore protein CsgA [Fredinandcohnia sp. SECRCQ15]MCH1624700.1 sigma-G-dependent sporulation-specific acid-soluble spore protein CsgA [Fredinandcohnia sp. SECRCQ15]